MIDFEYTEESKGIISYVNERGEVVSTYPLADFEKWANDLYLDEWKADFEESGREFNPMKIKYQEKYFGKFDQYVSEIYIDENFEELTKAFYIEMNPSEFKSKNTEQETRRVS